MTIALNDTIADTLSERSRAIAEFRELADFLERTPLIPVPSFNNFLVRVNTREEIAAIAKLGNWEKVYNGEYFSLVRRFGTHTLDVYIARSVVCRKVVTGQRVVPAEPEHVEDITDWICDEPSLLAKAEGGAA